MKHSCDEREDPVERMVRDLTAEEFVAWLVKYHNLPESAGDTVVRNLREQYRWHRLQGRLDKSGAALVIAELLNMRRSPLMLETPKLDEA